MNVDAKDEMYSLFDTYATNLSWYYPDLADTFVCPLCLKLYARDSISWAQLSLEHIIPRKAGGSLRTLTCKQCNNTTGSVLDSQMVRRLQSEVPGARVPVHVTFGNGEFRGTFCIVDGNIVFIANQKQSNPNDLQRLNEALQQGEIEGRFSLDLGYTQSRSLIAVVRGAYLLMFSQFGYEYILHENSDAIRRQISNPQPQTSILKGVSWSSRSQPIGPGIRFIEIGDELRGFMVTLALSHGNHCASVILPGLGCDFSHFYERLGRLRDDGVDFRTWLIPQTTEYLMNPDFKWGLRNGWLALFGAG